MRPGDVVGPVETEFGYHIIKLEKIRGPERQARHILIRPEITPDDIARARARADSFATAARGGASLTQLAEASKTPSDQIQRRNVPVDRLPEPYAALRDAQAGTVVGPIEVQGGAGGTSFAVVRVTERQPEGQYELADVAEQVRGRLQEQKLIELIVAELRQTTHVAIQLSPAGA
jgi:peptidyl-prolyl cis-trans isomerase SurA